VATKALLSPLMSYFESNIGYFYHRKSISELLSATFGSPAAACGEWRQKTF